MTGITVEFNLFIQELHKFEEKCQPEDAIFISSLIAALKKAIENKNQDLEIYCKDIEKVVSNCVPFKEPTLNELVSVKIISYCRKQLEYRDALCARLLQTIYLCKTVNDFSLLHPDILTVELLDVLLKIFPKKDIKNQILQTTFEALFQAIISSQIFARKQLHMIAGRLLHKAEGMASSLRAARQHAAPKRFEAGDYQHVQLTPLALAKIKRREDHRGPVSAPNPTREKFECAKRETKSNPSSPTTTAGDAPSIPSSWSASALPISSFQRPSFVPPLSLSMVHAGETVERRRTTSGVKDVTKSFAKLFLEVDETPEQQQSKEGMNKKL